MRTQRPIYIDLLPPCNHASPAGENIQAWRRGRKAAAGADGPAIGLVEVAPALLAAWQAGEAAAVAAVEHAIACSEAVLLIPPVLSPASWAKALGGSL